MRNHILKGLVAFVLFAALCLLPIQADAQLSGWIWTEGPYGYSLGEVSWLYFYSDGVTQSYNFSTGEWQSDINGWIYVQWPYYYSVNENSWMYASPPPGGFWVYNFATGQWTQMQ